MQVLNTLVSKRILCVEESVHVLFDESNSLLENDAQDEDVKLGLTKKDLLRTYEEGKNPQVGLGTEPVSKKEWQGQGFKQTGELLVNPIWSRIIFQK